MSLIEGRGVREVTLGLFMIGAEAFPAPAGWGQPSPTFCAGLLSGPWRLMGSGVTVPGYNSGDRAGRATSAAPKKFFCPPQKRVLVDHSSWNPILRFDPLLFPACSAFTIRTVLILRSSITCGSECHPQNEPWKWTDQKVGWLKVTVVGAPRRNTMKEPSGKAVSDLSSKPCPTCRQPVPAKPPVE